MNYYVIAGEASGDLHGAHLLKALKQVDATARFRGWGGDLMQAQGAELVKHYQQLAFMGFVEVAMHLRTILKNIKFCKQDILAHKPDALILIDYPGFNLRIAQWAKQQHIRVFYYISPTVWAWKENRSRIIKNSVERLYTILPFEKSFYAKRGVEVDYFGHPLSDILKKEQAQISNRETFLNKHHLSEKPIIAVLPGSRVQEIKKMLPVMLQVIPHFPQYQFVLGGTQALPRDLYQNTIKGHNIHLIFNDTYALMHHAELGIIKSGTSSLEAALFKLPHVVCYTANALSYAIAKQVVNKELKYISLVNLILNKPVVAELIQGDFSSEKMVLELKKMQETDKSYQISHDYNLLENLLQDENISTKIAADITTRLREKPC
ncbi:MAG: lipid-A-disaccharide synthase [Bacteroidetes bacterium]|nr:lipid-A-disaccharide synthase [Bacteroidota bacterium]